MSLDFNINYFVLYLYKCKFLNILFSPQVINKTDQIQNFKAYYHFLPSKTP